MEHVKGQEQSHSQAVHCRIFIFLAILALTGLYCTSQLDAKVYRWIDENGVKHFSTTPPVNAGNVKIMFDEYQHDEVADQERVMNDQKELDALIEKNTKEKQQASVEAQKKLMEEQEKLEEAKQNQPPLVATGCFSPSYSVLQGRHADEVVRPRDLMEGEYQDLQKLFQGLDGFWAGNARMLSCTETPDERREKIDNFSIKSEGKFLSRGQFILKSDLYSKELTSTHHELLRLYLNEEKLSKQPDIKVAEIELISVSSDELVYVYKGHTTTNVYEVVTTIKKTGEASFSLEGATYVFGRLLKKDIWHLESI